MNMLYEQSKRNIKLGVLPITLEQVRYQELVIYFMEFLL